MLKKFVTKVGAFCGIQAILMSGALTLYLHHRDEIAKQHFLAATIDKHELLETQTGPRLIFVGGSNVAFGIDSQYIAQKVNYNPVNMGLHAGLGLEYFLREVEDQLRTGDIVVVSLEYEHFASQKPALPERLFSTLDSRPGNAQFVPAYYLPALSDKALIHLGGLLRGTRDSVLGELELDPIYRRSSFNQVGDVVGHYDMGGQDLSKVAVDLAITEQSVQRAIKMLNEFNQLAEAKGVTVFFSYSPLLDRIYQQNQADIDLIQAELKAAADFTVIDRPENLAFSSEYFFDTEYHLNQKGVKRRAEHIARELIDRVPKAAAQVENNRS